MIAEPQLDEEAKSRRGQRVRSGDVLLVVVVAAVALVLVNVDPATLFGLLYHPVAGLILLIMIVEFLWLKSGDRTRVYKLEIDRLRLQRRHDEDLLRRTRQLLNEAAKEPRAEDFPQKVVELRREIEERL